MNMDWNYKGVMAFTCLGLSLALAGCGGGGGGSTPDGEGITAASVTKGTVKVLTDAQALAATFPSASSVEVPAAVDAQAGDVIAVGNTILKLVATEPASSSELKRFTTTPPHLDDVFSSLTLNGTLTGSNQLLAADAAGRMQALSASTNSCASDPAVLGLSGARCSFTVRSTEYPIVSLAGSAGVGHKLELKQWDVINNTGTGKITLSFDGDIAYKLNKDSTSLLVDGDTCTSTRAAVAGARARLFTIQVPTNIPAVNVRIPVCLAFDAKAGISGTIFKFSQQATIEIAVGNGIAPTLKSLPPSTSGTGRAADSEAWTVDGSTSTLATALVETSASGSLAAEISVEVAAGLPSKPEATIVDLGLSAAVTGKAAVSGKVAPAVVNIGKTLTSIAADPLYCLSIGMGVDLDLTGYAGLPALRFLGLDASASKKLFTKEVWKSPPAQLGKCDFRVKTDTTVTSSPNPGRDVTFTVSVLKNDPPSGGLWDDRKASGTAEVRNGAGAMLCTATIANGAGSCAYSYSGADRTEVVVAKYLGDTYFLASSSNSYEQIVGSSPDLSYTLELVTTVPFNEPGYDPTSTLVNCSPSEPFSNIPSVIGASCRGGTGLWVYLRCIGPGCVLNRFYALIAKRTFVTKEMPFPPYQSDVPNLRTLVQYGSPDGTFSQSPTTLTYPAPRGSVNSFWTFININPENWTYPLLSGVGSNYRDLFWTRVLTTLTGTPPPDRGIQIRGYQIDIVVRVYDSILDRYSELPLNLTLE